MSDSKLAAVQRWIGDSEAWVRALLARDLGGEGIVTIVMMGSAIRNRGHRRSDVDLLVVYRGERPKLRPPVEVDIRYQPLAGLEAVAKTGHEIVTWALKFGVVLYDPENIWSALQLQLGSNLRLPDEKEARERARRSLRVCGEMISAGDEEAASDLILAALTQLVRAELISRGVFPASRPELPVQLKALDPTNQLAELLSDAMYSDRNPGELYTQVASLRPAA